VEVSDDAHVVVIQKILDFVGDNDEEDMYLLVLEDSLLQVDNTLSLVCIHISIQQNQKQNHHITTQYPETNLRSF
jgi:hypothetical protein